MKDYYANACVALFGGPISWGTRSRRRIFILNLPLLSPPLMGSIAERTGKQRGVISALHLLLVDEGQQRGGGAVCKNLPVSTIGRLAMLELDEPGTSG